LYELARQLNIPENLLAESLYTALDFDKPYVLFYPCPENRNLYKAGVLVRLCFGLEDIYGYELVGFVVAGDCDQYKELHIDKLAYVYVDSSKDKCVVIVSEKPKDLFVEGKYRWCYQLLNDMREVREYL